MKEFAETMSFVACTVLMLAVVFALLSGELTSCAKRVDGVEPAPSGRIVSIEGHDYAVVRLDEGMAICHGASCHCRTER